MLYCVHVKWYCAVSKTKYKSSQFPRIFEWTLDLIQLYNCHQEIYLVKTCFFQSASICFTNSCKTGHFFVAHRLCHELSMFLTCWLSHCCSEMCVTGLSLWYKQRHTWFIKLKSWIWAYFWVCWFSTHSQTVKSNPCFTTHFLTTQFENCSSVPVQIVTFFSQNKEMINNCISLLSIMGKVYYNSKLWTFYFTMVHVHSITTLSAERRLWSWGNKVGINFCSSKSHLHCWDWIRPNGLKGHTEITGWQAPSIFIKSDIFAFW